MSLNRKVSIFAGIIVIVLSSGVAIYQSLDLGSKTTNLTTSSSIATSATSSTSVNSKSSNYTLADVAKHNNSSSCWSVINGKVYDLTAWISQHPGGQQAILSLCGIDGSSAFNNQHGGQHRPANELAGFSIGSLVK